MAARSALNVCVGFAGAFYDLFYVIAYMQMY